MTTMDRQCENCGNSHMYYAPRTNAAGREVDALVCPVCSSWYEESREAGEIEV